MKILFINQFFYPDSAATSQYLTDLVRSISPPDSATVICGSSEYASQLPPAAGPRATVLRVPTRAFSRAIHRRLACYFTFFAGATRAALLAATPDVVVTLTTPPFIALIGTLLNLRRNCRHVIWQMDVYPDIALSSRLPPPLRWLLALSFPLARYIHRRADAVLVLGECMKARLEAHGVNPDNIHVTENWADGREIAPRPFPDGPFVVYYSGNLGLAHDVVTIAEAMRALRADSRFRFVFAGAGPRRRELQRFCIAHRIPADFRPYVNRADLGSSLAEGHVGLVTQLPETCGAVVPSKTYGIMAAGRPLLYIGPVGSTPALIIQRHNCGWRIEPGDSQGLIRLLELLSANPDFIRQAGARARQAFEQHYDRPIGIARINAVLGLNSGAGSRALASHL